LRPTLPLFAYPIVRADYFLIFFPPLMEALATGRISVAQTAQRILHKAKNPTPDRSTAPRWQSRFFKKS